MGEDPEVMLQDAIEEMRITMPKLNMVLVATRATVIRLEEERDPEGGDERRQRQQVPTFARSVAATIASSARWPYRAARSCPSESCFIGNPR